MIIRSTLLASALTWLSFLIPKPIATGILKIG